MGLVLTLPILDFFVYTIINVVFYGGNLLKMNSVRKAFLFFLQNRGLTELFFSFWGSFSCNLAKCFFSLWGVTDFSAASQILTLNNRA